MAGWDNHEDVCDQLRSIGLVIDGPLQLADHLPAGKVSARCFTKDDKAEKRGWYRLHEWEMEPGVRLLVGTYGVFNGADAGLFKVELSKLCKGCGASVSLRAKVCQSCGETTFKPRELTTEQRAAFKALIEENKKRAAAERAAADARATQWATAVWRACAEAAPGGHQYLVKKQLAGTGGARIFAGNDGIMLDGAEKEDYSYLASFAGSLVIPLCDANGAVHGLQFIAERADPKTGRDKTYWPRGMVAEAHSWTIGGAPRRLALITEGFATALTLHEATGQPVVVAFAANNLLPVAGAIAKRTRNRARLLVCADDDWLQRCLECKTYTPAAAPACVACGKPHRQRNAGMERAAETAMAVDQAKVFVPVFAADRPSDRKGPTDFNDLACIEGLQVVTAQYERRLAELEWQAHATATPYPTSSCASAPAASPAGAREKGGGEHKRPDARAIMDLDDIVERFIPIDDGTGDYVFDTWTRKLVKRSQMVTLLPAGVRSDDIKRHYRWATRGAYYFDEIGFDPSEQNPEVRLNTWQGWPMRPKSGCCQRLLDLIEYLCSKDPNGRANALWLLQWMAYPLQHPGAKMSSAVIMHGPQGTGKSTVFQALAKIYGGYATVLNQRGLEDRFNADWVDNMLFLLAEEVVTRAEMWHIKGELKELVTGDWLRVNDKHVKAYRQRNHINIVLLSNEDQPLPLDNDDRRHFVIYNPPEQPEEYYDELRAELDSGGVEAFYHHLLHLDLTGFHPKKRPPVTAAKTALIALSAGSETRFVQAWIAQDLDLPVCPCLATDLYAEYLKWCRANGEFKPRPSNQFFGTLSNLKGWDKRKSRIYRDLNSDEALNRPIVTPPIEALQAAGISPPPADTMPRWLTEHVTAFNTAAQLAGQSPKGGHP